MGMVIHNLPTKHKAFLEILWDMESDQVMSFIKSLPYKDMRDIAYLIEVVKAGGDEVTDVSDARLVLDKIAKL
jgi:hypothetical protein